MINGLLMIVITVWTVQHTHGVRVIPVKLNYALEKLYPMDECEQARQYIMEHWVPKKRHTSIQCVATDNRNI